METNGLIESAPDVEFVGASAYWVGISTGENRDTCEDSQAGHPQGYF